MNNLVEQATHGIRMVTVMRSILALLNSLGSAGALRNARTELELSHGRQVQAAILARRVGTIDAVAGRADVRALSRPVPIAAQAGLVAAATAA